MLCMEYRQMLVRHDLETCSSLWAESASELADLRSAEIMCRGEAIEPWYRQKCGSRERIRGVETEVTHQGRNIRDGAIPWCPQEELVQSAGASYYEGVCAEAQIETPNLVFARFQHPRQARCDAHVG
mmetsp:Transcript_30018/g.82365  ORF Transcript_30018/g.82365 Transcript_30018/m.82365 type:complete len:127 (-) Transcript_30018:2556-2936(-)